MIEDRTPTKVWDDIKAHTDLAEPGENTDMAGCGVEGDAEPLPDGDGDRDRGDEF